jgi:hypothetical protein
MRLITFNSEFHKRCVAQCDAEVEQVDVAALQVGTGRERERGEREGGHTRWWTPSKLKNKTERQLLLLPFRKRVSFRFFCSRQRLICVTTQLYYESTAIESPQTLETATVLFWFTFLVTFYRRSPKTLYR